MTNTLKRLTVAIAAAFTAPAVVAYDVFASSDTVLQASGGEHMTPDQIIEKVKAAGYTDIRKIENEHGRYEVKVRDADGKRLELKVDAKTGEIVRKKREDD